MSAGVHAMTAAVDKMLDKKLSMDVATQKMMEGNRVWLREFNQSMLTEVC